MQAKESNENTSFVPQIPITINPTVDARVVAEFFLELIKQKLPQDIAKDLAIAYILKQNPFGQ